MSLGRHNALCLAFLIASPAFAQDIVPAFAPTQPAGPLEIVPEAYRPNELGDKYLADVQQYLDDHPDSPYAPRMLFEMLLVAEELDLEETADRCRAELMISHPKSRQCHCLLKTFHRARDFWESLLPALKPLVWNSELTAKLSPIFEEALDRWPDTLIEQPSPMMYLAVRASVERPSPKIDHAVEAVLDRAGRPEIRRAVEVLRNRSAPAPELFAALLDAELTKDDMERFLPELESRARGSEIAELNALWTKYDRQLTDKSFEEAQYTIERLTRKCSSQRVLWAQLLTAVILKRSENASAVERKIRTLGPDTLWAQAAQSFLAANDRRKEIVDMQVRAWLASLTAADADRSLCVQCDVKLWNDAPGDLLNSWRAVLQSDFTTTHLLKIEEHGETLALFEQKLPNRIRVYFPPVFRDQILLHDVKFGKLIGTLKLDFDRSTSQFFMMQGLEVKSSAKINPGLNVDVYFSLDEPGLRQFCDDQRLGWVFPLNCEERDDCYRFEWGYISYDSPHVQRFDWEICKAGFLHRLHVHNATDQHDGTLDIAYGNLAQLKLNPIDWPDLPEQTLSPSRAVRRYALGGLKLLRTYAQIEHPELQAFLHLFAREVATLNRRLNQPGEDQPLRIATDPNPSGDARIE